MTRPARIAMATFEYGASRPGEVAALVTSLCEHLDGMRFAPVVVLPRANYAPSWAHVARHAMPSGVADVYRENGVELWLLDGHGYPERTAQLDVYGERLADLLPVLAADVLHLHDAYGYKALHEARRRGLPSLLTVHRAHADAPLHLAEQVAAHLADEIATVSAGYASERALFAARGHVVPAGVDLGFWTEAALLDPRAERLRALQHVLELPAQPTFAYFGRLDDRRGIDVLLAAHRPDAGYNLIVAGDGDREVIARVRAAGLRFVHRQLARHEMRELLGAVDAVVMPSRDEPSALRALEAMALGALPIASRVGGLGDAIADLAQPGGFGRVVPAGDAAALAAAMQDIARIADLAPLRMRAKARAALFPARAMASGYEAIYAAMCASERMRRAS